MNCRRKTSLMNKLPPSFVLSVLELHDANRTGDACNIKSHCLIERIAIEYLKY